MKCAYCGKEIDRPQDAWRQMAVWVSPRGGKSSFGAERTGLMMHEACTHLTRQGRAPGQGRLG